MGRSRSRKRPRRPRSSSSSTRSRGRNRAKGKSSKGKAAKEKASGRRRSPSRSRSRQRRASPETRDGRQGKRLMALEDDPDTLAKKTARAEQEVQKRLQERIAAPQFEAALQEKLEDEVRRHLSVLKVELEMEKKRQIDDFRAAKLQQENAKQELELILRKNQRKMQEHQLEIAQQHAVQAQALVQERDQMQKRKEHIQNVKKRQDHLRQPLDDVLS